VDHLNPEQLAALAAEPTFSLPADEQEHLSSCPVCRAELAELGALVHDVRAARSTEVRTPRPEVWAAVERELASDAPTPTDAAAAAGVPRLLPRRGRRRFATTAVAAAAGLVVGVGGTLGVLAARSPAQPAGPTGPALVATTVLAALPGETGQGTAELVRADDTLQLRVHAALGSSPTGDYHEVWLLNRDGQRMYALGVLPSSGDASYWLPAPLGARLDGYATVDISLEPEDGDTAHSQHSLVRGQLPA
jgi:anti-sigma-K factor RskA